MPFTLTAMSCVVIASVAASVLLRPRLGTGRAVLVGSGVLVTGTGALVVLLTVMIAGMD